MRLTRWTRELFLGIMWVGLLNADAPRLSCSNWLALMLSKNISLFLALNGFTNNIFRLNRGDLQVFKGGNVYFCCEFMSAPLDVASDWNFRVFDKRLIVVKTKSESARKIAVLDVLTNLMFAVEVPDMISMQELNVDAEYLANLNVFTAKDMKGVDVDFLNFFEAVDVDQNMDDFIKAYWVYPSKIRFELVELEEP